MLEVAVPLVEPAVDRQLPVGAAGMQMLGVADHKQMLKVAGPALGSLRPQALHQRRHSDLLVGTIHMLVAADTVHGGRMEIGYSTLEVERLDMHTHGQGASLLQLMEVQLPVEDIRKQA